MAAKGKTAVLALSLAANAALAALVVIKVPVFLGLADPGASAPPGRAARAAPSAGRDWKAVSSRDLKDQIAELRAEGFPPNIVQGIIRAELDRAYNARRDEVLARFPKGGYWEPSYARSNFQAVLGLNLIQEEENGRMRELFGAGADNTAYDTGHFMPPIMNLRGQSEALPPEKFSKVAAILSDYNAMRADLYNQANGLMDPEANAKGEYLRKQQEADIEAALSPGELLEYNLRTSPAANVLRWNLQAFKPSEDEFRAIYQAQDDFNRKYSTDAGLSGDDVQKQRDAHKAELDADVQSALGPDRFAQYQVETQADYPSASRVVDALNLPAASAQQVLDVEADINKRASAIRGDKSLPEAERTAQLASLSGEAQSRLSTVLGDKGVALYKANGGFWLSSLPPPPK